MIKRYRRQWIGILAAGIFVVAMPLSAVAEGTAPETGSNIDLSAVRFLGLELKSANLNKVREHLWGIGGFTQARSTVRQRNLDKFFTQSRIQDSYYIEFRYNNAGNVTSVKRLYRPYSVENSNRRTPITTREVALKLIPDLGQPIQVVTKGWGGTLAYSSYRWEDDNMSIVVDREGSESLGNIFVEYTVKSESPYAIAQR